MEKSVEKIGLINLITLLLVGCCATWMAYYSGSQTVLISVVFIIMGFIVGCVNYFQMRLGVREWNERLEVEELKRNADNSALFGTDTELYPARRAREQFEKYFVPIFTCLLAVSQGIAAWFLWRIIDKATTPPVTGRALLTMALLGVIGLLLFIVGRYAAGLSKITHHRLLQAGASYLMMGSVLCLFCTAVEAAVWFDYSGTDKIVARVLTIFLAIVAIETILSLVMEIYRPRTRGLEGRVLYESRLIGLLGQPDGLIRTAAEALDYQFGFKVSETWFYRFLENALAWIVLAQLALLFVSSSVVVVASNEEAILERFGKPVPGKEVLQSGFHLKYPWPIDKVYRYPSHEIKTIYVGFKNEETHPVENQVILWTRSHFKEEFNMLVASKDVTSATQDSNSERAVPVNLLSVNIPIQYRVKDIRSWLLKNENSATLLESAANREVIRYLVNVDLEEIMAEGRMKAAEEIKQGIQKDVEGLGAEITFVGLEGIHPPIKVADAWEAVIGSLQEKQISILNADAYAAAKIPTSHAEATNIVLTADSLGQSKTNIAYAQAQSFANQEKAWQASPSVYTQHSYLETLAKATKDTRKFVIGTTNSHETIWLNLEDLLNKDLFRDLNVNTEK